MKTLLLVLLPLALLGADRKPPQGQVENDGVLLTATIISGEQLRELFSTDFDGHFTVMEVRLAPKAGHPVEIRLDDFLLRSNSDLSHSGPLVAAQVADTGGLAVKQTFAPRANEQAPAMLTGSQIEVKQGSGQPELLALLKQKILSEKTAAGVAQGLLFFPLEREKPKSLVLVYTTPAGKLRLQFK